LRLRLWDEYSTLLDKPSFLATIVRPAGFCFAYPAQPEQKLYKRVVMKIANHIVSAEQVHAGSTIYKAARRGGGYVAIQIFPFQLSEEQYRFLEEQAGLLTRAFEEQNAAIPRVLNYGRTQTDSFPFIETEWIESDSAGESNLMEPVYSIEEISRIAEQISSVLAHCEKLKLVHGHITKNSIIWHRWRKRYVLTGFRFGLTLQEGYAKKPVSLFYQKEHKKDIHDLGMVLLQLTRSALSNSSGADSFELHPSGPENKNKQTDAPGWLVTLIEKCITDNKESFQHAGEVYDYVLQHYKPSLQKDWYRSKPQQPLPASPKPSLNKRSLVSPKIFSPAWMFAKQMQGMRFVWDRQIIIGLIVAALLAGLGIFAQKRDGAKEPGDEVASDSTTTSTRTNEQSIQTKDTSFNIYPTNEPKKETPKISSATKTAASKNTDTDNLPKTEPANKDNLSSYKVRSRAYFYNEPNESTKRNAFIVHWNNAVLHQLKEEGDFIYVVFTNHEGQTSKGWLHKKDLIRL
jgi:hypothetical protein